MSPAHSETNEAGVIYVGLLWEMHILCSQNIISSVQPERKDAFKTDTRPMLYKENQNIVYKNGWRICNLQEFSLKYF